MRFNKKDKTICVLIDLPLTPWSTMLGITDCLKILENLPDTLEVCEERSKALK